LPSTAGWLLRNASGSAGGACWAGTGDAMGKRLRARTVGVDAAPEFMPKRNYQPIASSANNAETPRALRLASCRSLASVPDRPCLRVRAGICTLTSEVPGGCSGVTRASTSMLLAQANSLRAEAWTCPGSRRERSVDCRTRGGITTLGSGGLAPLPRKEFQ
jgi:hypothetical protein